MIRPGSPPGRPAPGPRPPPAPGPAPRRRYGHRAPRDHHHRARCPPRTTSSCRPASTCPTVRAVRRRGTSPPVVADDGERPARATPSRGRASASGVRSADGGRHATSYSQRVAAGPVSGQWSAGDAARRPRPSPPGPAGRVGQVQPGDRLAVQPAQPYAQRVGAGGVQGDAAPVERDQRAARSVLRSGVRARPAGPRASPRRAARGARRTGGVGLSGSATSA